VTKLKVNGLWTQFTDPLLKGEDFVTHGTLRGYETAGSPFSGRLDASWHPFFENVDYVVYSYSTPIAWRSADGVWFMPDDRYSVTTSKQQGRISTALYSLEQDGKIPPVQRSIASMHVKYPHEAGRLFDCPACEARCHCTPDTAQCVFEGEHVSL